MYCARCSLSFTDDAEFSQPGCNCHHDIEEMTDAEFAEVYDSLPAHVREYFKPPTSALLQLEARELENMNILATRGETQYWNVDAATLKTQIGESNLRAFLRKLDTEISGVVVWWDEDTEQSGEYDFAVRLCESCFFQHPHQSKPVCTCD